MACALPVKSSNALQAVYKWYLPGICCLLLCIIRSCHSRDIKIQGTMGKREARLGSTVLD